MEVTPKKLHTFESPVSSIHVTKHTAYVVIGGDTLTPVPYKGSLTFPLRVEGLSVLASPNSQMDKALHPPDYLVFTTEEKEEHLLHAWVGSHTTRPLRTKKIHSLCLGPDGLIFAGLKDELQVFPFQIHKGLTEGCQVACNGTIHAVRARAMGKSVRLFTKSQTGLWSVFNFEIDQKSFGEKRQLDPFGFLYSSSSNDYGIFNQNQSIHSISLDFDNEESMRYEIPGDIKDVGVWHGGLVFLLKNKRVIVVPCSGDIEQQESWTYIHDRPYGKIAVWGNKLLLVSGCSVYEYPLPK